jgi:hypothetical protein
MMGFYGANSAIAPSRSEPFRIARSAKTVFKLPIGGLKSELSAQMDILYFLKARTAFIRSHYDIAAGAFEAIKRQIEKKEPPFHDSPSSEDGEPAFLEEWIDADTSIRLVGLACGSLLHDALKLYLNFMQRERLRFAFDEADTNRLKKDFVATYRDALGEIFDTDWQETGVDFGVIEQTALARNRAQHGTTLTTFHEAHDKRTLRKHPRPHFADKREIEAWEDAGRPNNMFVTPTITVSRETLFAAIDAVEHLAEWMEANMARVERWREAQRREHPDDSTG